jgi:DNA-binding MarR family transcriptional regulator
MPIDPPPGAPQLPAEDPTGKPAGVVTDVSSASTSCATEASISSAPDQRAQDEMIAAPGTYDPTWEALRSRPGYLIRRLNQIHYAMFIEECNIEGITPVQYGILTVLASQPGLDQTAIGFELGLDRTTTADVLRRLEEKGYLERRVNPADRRSRQAYITTAGRRLKDKLHAGMQRSQDRFLAPLSPQDRARFMSLLSVLVECNNQYGRAAARV